MQQMQRRTVFVSLLLLVLLAMITIMNMIIINLHCGIAVLGEMIAVDSSVIMVQEKILGVD